MKIGLLRKFIRLKRSKFGAPFLCQGVGAIKEATFLVRSGGPDVELKYNNFLQPTKPLVTALACARPAPTDFAAEENVRLNQ